MSITNYLRYQYGVTNYSRSSGSGICCRNRNEVNNNEMVFSAGDRVLIKLLRQKKEYDVKMFIAEFPSKPWTLLGLNKRLHNTGHLRFETTSQKPL